MLNIENTLSLVQFAYGILEPLMNTQFSKHADDEIRAACTIVKTLDTEQNPREGLIRILSHLESAFVAYEHCVFTLDVLHLFDGKYTVYKKAGKLNQIAERIAQIHYNLGNVEVGRHWLLYRMRPDGKYNFDESIYQEIMGDQFSVFRDTIMVPSNNCYADIQLTKEIRLEREEYEVHIP